MKIINIKKLSCTWRNVYQVILDSKSNYEPGDAIGLITPNSDVLVNRLMGLCRIENVEYKIERTGKSSFTYVGSIRDFLKYKYDFTSIPKKIHLLNVANKSEKKNHVEYLCSKEGAMDYMKLSVCGNTIVEIIEEFGCKPSLEELIRNCDFIKPRYYSLINDKAGCFEILLGEISNEIEQIIRMGHVSGFIKNVFESNTINNSNLLNENAQTTIDVTFRQNILTTQFNSPRLICFCTGTGIAPFISLYRNKHPDQQITLVYGYRNDEDDLSSHYDLHCTVLRAKSSLGVYVSDFCSIIDESSHIFICGNMKMQKSMFLKIKEKFPQMIAEKKIFFDNWQ